MTFIALAIAALAAFGFYTANADETCRLLITIGAGLSLFITLGGILALSPPNGGTLNIKLTSILFFIALLIEHLAFSFTTVKFTPYIIITGILMLVYVLICYGISRALK